MSDSRHHLHMAVVDLRRRYGEGVDWVETAIDALMIEARKLRRDPSIDVRTSTSGGNAGRRKLMKEIEKRFAS